jgi:hypothetical protein
VLVAVAVLSAQAGGSMIWASAGGLEQKGQVPGSKESILGSLEGMKDEDKHKEVKRGKKWLKALHDRHDNATEIADALGKSDDGLVLLSALSGQLAEALNQSGHGEKGEKDSEEAEPLAGLDALLKHGEQDEVSAAGDLTHGGHGAKDGKEEEQEDPMAVLDALANHGKEVENEGENTTTTLGLFAK